MPLALSPNSIGSKDPHALKIPARKGGIRLTSENAAVAVHADRDDGVCPDRSSRKPRSLRQVESKERCSSSEPLWISGPPSSWITLCRSRSAATFLREGSSCRSRMISPPSSQMLSTCFRMVFGERLDEARCSRNGRKQTSSCSPGGQVFFQPPSTSAASYSDRGSRRKYRRTAPTWPRGLLWKSSSSTSSAPWN